MAESKRSLSAKLGAGHSSMVAYRPLLEVLRFLGFSEVLLCSQVCSFWRKVADSDELWQSIGALTCFQCTSKQEFRGAF